VPEARAHHSVHSHPNGPLLHGSGLRGCGFEGRGLPPARPPAPMSGVHYCHCNKKIIVSSRQSMYAVFCHCDVFPNDHRCRLGPMSAPVRIHGFLSRFFLSRRCTVLAPPLAVEAEIISVEEIVRGAFCDKSRCNCNGYTPPMHIVLLL